MVVSLECHLENWKNTSLHGVQSNKCWIQETVPQLRITGKLIRKQPKTFTERSARRAFWASSSLRLWSVAKPWATEAASLRVPTTVRGLARPNGRPTRQLRRRYRWPVQRNSWLWMYNAYSAEITRVAKTELWRNFVCGMIQSLVAHAAPCATSHSSKLVTMNVQMPVTLKICTAEQTERRRNFVRRMM